jgi:uncharacterized protein (DUF4415 family)
MAVSHDKTSSQSEKWPGTVMHPCYHHDVRTTITLEDDIAAKLEERMRETGKSFKETVNAALRVGLMHSTRQPVREPFRVRARAMGLRSGLSYDSVEDLLDQIDGVLRR